MVIVHYIMRIWILSWACGHKPISLALRRLRQEDLCKFKVSLVYRMDSRTAGLHGETLSPNKQITVIM